MGEARRGAEALPRGLDARLARLALALLVLACAEGAPRGPTEEVSLEERVATLQAKIEVWRGLQFRSPVEMERREPERAEIAGWYEPAAKRLYLAPRARGHFGDGVLLHELVHALQDQHFDLVTLHEQAGSDEERSDALQALIEGEAMLAVMELLAYDFEAVAEKSELSDDDPTLFRYRDGSRYVRSVREACGWGAVDALFLHPPTRRAEITAVSRGETTPECR